MKKDIYHSQRTFAEWKRHVEEYGIDGLSDANTDLLYQYLVDMELGKNVSRGTKKGPRTFTRLNALRIKLIWIVKQLESRAVRDLTKLKENQVVALFHDMAKGTLTRRDGRRFTSSADYVKDFKSFWHWLMKVKKKEGIALDDITDDLDTSKEENTFVYFTLEQLREMMPYFTPDEQVRMLFMFDTLVRSPTELMNIRVEDLSPDFRELTIRDETSKTYGRTIKLLLCSEELRRYVDRTELKPKDFLFSFSPPLFNKKLQRVARQLWGDRMSKGGSRFSELTMYDFRHSGACHWRLGAYRSKIDALMYRGGWSNLQILNYYTKKLGMRDSIEKDDLLIGVDKNELERQIEKLKDELRAVKRYVRESRKAMVAVQQRV